MSSERHINPPVTLGHGDVLVFGGAVTDRNGSASSSVTDVAVERADGTVERHRRDDTGWHQLSDAPES